MYRFEDEKPWWQQDANEVLDLSNDIEHGETKLYGHETPEGWEYAKVWWFSGSATLQVRFRNGRVLGEDET
jgi:hypothetical protein